METVGAELSLYRARPTDLPAFLPYACGQLQAPFSVRVLLLPVEEYESKSDDKSKKSKRDKPAAPAPQTSDPEPSAEREEASAAPDYGDEDEVVMRARCDSLGHPAELVFYRCTQLPRLLMKIIGLCIPYHTQLTRITIRWGPLEGSVVYEIAKFLPMSQITDVCLDDSPVPHPNYCMLLEPPSRLRSLSLARCGLLDEDAVSLAARLLHPLPASRTLATLSLEANGIGDAGARALAEALRTNRRLRHLNLAGNAITPSGAAQIFRSLVQFPVSPDEIALKRRRTFDYLKLKREAYERCYRELTSSAESPQESSRARKKTAITRSRRSSAVSLAGRSSGMDALACRAEMLAEELVDAYADPFDGTELVTRDGAAYCVGNFALASLNLAYNNLDNGSAGQLARVLAYQAGARPRRAGTGLVRAALEGNAMPACDALRLASALLERAQTPPDMLPLRPSRKSERAKIK